MIPLLSLAILAVLALRRWRRAGARTAPSLPDARNPFHSVTVVAGPDACERARLLAQHDCALLPTDVPPLPLPGCERAHCDCRYAHHPDRRRRLRRAEDRGWPSRSVDGRDRRRRLERRREDREPAQGNP